MPWLPQICTERFLSDDLCELNYPVYYKVRKIGNYWNAGVLK